MSEVNVATSELPKNLAVLDELGGPPEIPASLSGKVESSRTRVEQNLSWHQMQKIVGEMMAELTRGIKGVSQEDIDMVGDLLGGPYHRLDRATLVEGTEDRKKKEVSARIQHNQVDAIFYAASGAADPMYVDAVHSIVSVFERIAHSDYGVTDGLLSLWNGIKAEIAIIKTLHEAGYRVIIPDYSDESREVMDWDVRAGVDFIAIKEAGEPEEGEPRQGPDIFLVNAKGRLRDEGGSGYIDSSASVEAGPNIKVNDKDDVQSREKKVAEWGRLPDSLRKALAKENPRAVMRAKVTVPTADQYMQSLAECATRTDDMRMQLANFATVHDRARKDIIGGLSVARASV